MPIKEALLKSIKCCLNKDDHIVLDPVMIGCQKGQGVACKKCIIDCKDKNIYCNRCHNYHEKANLLNATPFEFVETFIENSLNDLFEYVDEKLKDSFNNLKSK